jgi:hypothetical protein
MKRIFGSVFGTTVGYVFFLLCAIMAVTASFAFSQPAIVSFCYWDDGAPPLEPPLTNSAGVPIPDGTPIRIMHDLGTLGPDSGDALLFGSAFNGAAMGIGAGYFFTDPSAIQNSGIPVYLAITAPGICWYSVTDTVAPGSQQRCLQWSEWTQAEPPCPWHAPAATVVFSYCIYPPYYWERPLGCPCSNPGQDNFVTVMHDINLNGADAADTALTTFIADDHVFDCVWVSPTLTLPSDVPIYLRIGQDCCWKTAVYLVAPPSMYVDLRWGSWTCGDAECAALGVPHAETPVLPKQPKLVGVFPNPFNSNTVIRYELSSRNFVRVRVFDLLGREVATLFSGNAEAGSHESRWDASRCASGIYFVNLQAGTRSMTQKVMLLK